MDTITNIFSVDMAFCNYFVTMQREPMISNVVKNSWNLNFADFRELVFNFYQRQPPEVFYKKSCS